MKQGTFYAVGVGVGDPMDMTLRAKQVLETADVILIPVKKAGEPSAAFRIAQQAADMSRSEQIEMVFPMKAAKDYKTFLSGDVLSPIRRRLEAGKTVAMVTLGDVSVYSTATYVRQVLEQDGYRTGVIAGIPTFCTAAARAGVSLCENEESMMVLPGVCSAEKLVELLEQFDTLLIMKAGKALPWLVPLLKQKNLEQNTLMFCNVGMEQEYIGPVQMESVGYFTTLLIKRGGLKEWYIL